MIGPSAAITSSCDARRGAFASCETPPTSISVIERTRPPNRIAARLCASSWTTTDANSPSVSSSPHASGGSVS